MLAEGDPELFPLVVHLGLVLVQGPSRWWSAGRDSRNGLRMKLKGSEVGVVQVARVGVRGEEVTTG